MSQFRFSLTDEEKTYLKGLVRQSIATALEGKAYTPPPPPTDKMRQSLGAFVTLKLGGHLRGCIGHIIGDKPLYLTVAEMARAAAFDDPRFSPLSRQEFDRLDIEISILSPFTTCPDVNQIEPGRHGLMIRKGYSAGLLLPQVATEWGWDRETFLSQTCRKAGLPANAWKDQGAVIEWFEAEVF